MFNYGIYKVFVDTVLCKIYVVSLSLSVTFEVCARKANSIKMEESLVYATSIENIGQMLSRFGEETKKKDSFEMMEEQCKEADLREELFIRESPKG